MNLNEPTPDVDTTNEVAWTPRRGLMRAAWRLAVVAVVAAALLWPITASFPIVILNAVFRSFVTLILAWIMYAVAQRAAGFVGLPVSLLAISAVLLVLLSTHVGFSIYGVPMRNGARVSGATWFSAAVLLGVNAVPGVVLVFATVLCDRFGVDWRTLVAILRQRV